MAISAYTRTTYNNRAAPAGGPTNLNKNEAQLKAISDEFTGSLIRPTDTKATIVDADEVMGNNSASSPTFKWVKWSWTTIKAFLKTYFDSIYWGAHNDGNGGQPPSPKPSATPIGGTNAVGQSYTDSLPAGSTLYYSGSSNITGTWRVVSLVFTTAGAVNAGLTNMGANGSGTFITVPAGHTCIYSTVRTA